MLRVFGEAFADVAPWPRWWTAKWSCGLAAYVLDKFEQDRRGIYIYDLAVSEGTGAWASPLD
jgi:hypothetical protein